MPNLALFFPYLYQFFDFFQLFSASFQCFPALFQTLPMLSLEKVPRPKLQVQIVESKEQKLYCREERAKVGELGKKRRELYLVALEWRRTMRQARNCFAQSGHKVSKKSPKTRLVTDVGHTKCSFSATKLDKVARSLLFSLCKFVAQSIEAQTCTEPELGVCWKLSNRRPIRPIRPVRAAPKCWRATNVQPGATVSPGSCGWREVGRQSE